MIGLRLNNYLENFQVESVYFSGDFGMGYSSSSSAAMKRQRSRARQSFLSITFIVIVTYSITEHYIIVY